MALVHVGIHKGVDGCAFVARERFIVETFATQLMVTPIVCFVAMVGMTAIFAVEIRLLPTRLTVKMLAASVRIIAPQWLFTPVALDVESVVTAITVISAAVLVDAANDAIATMAALITAIRDGEARLNIAPHRHLIRAYFGAIIGVDDEVLAVVCDARMEVDVWTHEMTRGGRNA